MKHIYTTIIIPATSLLPILIGYKKKVFISKYLAIIFAYLIFAGIMIFPERILGSHHINNLPLLHFYTIVEFLFIARYFQKIFQTKLINQVATLISIVFTILSILNFIYIQDIYQYNSYPRPIAAIIIIFFCIYHIFWQAEKQQEKAWLKQPENWITVGLLVYFCSSLFYFAFLNIIYQRPTLTLYFILGDVHATLVLLMYVLFSKGFLVYKNER
ncbi:hypothetical protein BDD43_3931 [Mucilaginibacter gracilis]|uniref:Uncharacterized protein n=1 Tax=Mucilaginibacter gracilis TaxID=423350 RepID=A0A495J432_9SPHI|nr:hypothetical protein BDD43_3931 [Mucilaginibacter gracilis]